MMGLKYLNFKKPILIGAAMLLVALVAAPYVLAASQTWYLKSDISGSARIMYKSGGSTSNVTVNGGVPVVWRADEAANPAVGFSDADWTGQMWARSQNGTANVTVAIGSWDGGTFTQSGITSTFVVDTVAGDETYPLDIVVNSGWTVPETQYLALQISSARRIYVTTTGTSYVASPNSDPGYPVPDAGAIILFAAGLGIAGIIIWQLRKKDHQYRFSSIE